ncbi:flagellar hook-length control protein FliK [Marinomonas arenicola]|uniref:flagellar hook-length control protein FliK n=1 Tax=Marinomonas arenicola TaxID=569601 RepID=UPI00311D4A92
MQTVTSSVLSSSQPPSKSTISPHSSGADSRGQVFAENLQKAKRELASDAKSQSTQSKGEAVVSTDEGADKVTRSNPSQEGSVQESTLSSSNNDRSTSESSLQDGHSRASNGDLTSQAKNATQEKVIDNGKSLHHTGQDSPDSELLAKSGKTEPGVLRSVTEGADDVQNETSTAVTSDFRVSKTVPSTTPPVDAAMASKGEALGVNDASGIVDQVEGAQVTSDATAHSLQTNNLDQEMVEKVSGNKLVPSSDADNQNPNQAGVASELELAPEQSLSDAKPASELPSSDLPSSDLSGSDKSAPELSASGNTATNSLSSNQPLVASGVQPIKSQGTEKISDKVPAEVRALQAKEGKAKEVAAGLATIGLAAKGVNANGAKAALDKADAPMLLAKDGKVEPAKSSEAPDAADGTELSWVLSQMGGSAPAATVAATTASDAGVDKSSESGIPTPTTKVADQVALANEVKNAQPLAAGALAVGGAANGQTDGLTTDGNLASTIDKDSLLANEPLELRKKEQDAMIGKMTSQWDGASRDSESGGLNSSITATNNTTNRLSPAAANMQPMNSPQNLAMSVPPNHPGWAGEMGQKVAFVAQSGGHTAHIKLDPPELGSLTVKVSVDSDNNNTQVSFMAATPQARDLLESQMGRLRDMLAQQGMDLDSVDVGVSQQETSGGQYQDAREGGSTANTSRFLTGDDGDDDLSVRNISYVSPSGVDYYA